MSIKATKYEVEDLGRYFKTSKKKYKWYFQLEGKDHYLELEFSYLSGKRKLQLDGRPLHESMMLTSSFQYPFTLEGFALNVIQQGDSFELRINNKVFSHLYTQQRTQSEFIYEDNNREIEGGNIQMWNGKQSQDSNQFGDFSAFSKQPQQQNKFSLNIKLEKKPEETTNYQLPKKGGPSQIPSDFGAFGGKAFEDFEQFGQFGTKSQQGQQSNPFGEFGDFSNFNQQSESAPLQSQSTQQKQSAKVDLLDLLDEPVQQQTTQPTDTFQQPKQPDQQQNQTANLFDTGMSFNAPQQPQVQSPPINQVSPNLFEVFSNPTQPQQLTQQPLVQQTPNIMNLYGPQQQINPNFNLAYNSFPIQNEINQPIYQQQPLMNQPQYMPLNVVPQQPMMIQQPVIQNQQFNSPVQSTPFDLFK